MPQSDKNKIKTGLENFSPAFDLDILKFLLKKNNFNITFEVFY